MGLEQTAWKREPLRGRSREMGVGGKLPLRAEALSMLMDGIDLRGARMRPGMSASEERLRVFLAYT